MTRPNILWIVTTQWRAQALGYAGDANARTPQIDALAAESLNFREAVTPHPFGPFARAAMMTGVESPQNGVWDYFDALPTGMPTVAHAMRERGYATAFFGKWHLAKRDPEAALVGEAHARMIVPEEARGGFEMWEGFESGFLLNNPWLHGTRLPEPVQMRGYQSDVVCERAAEWIGAESAGGASGKSWFAVVSVEPPHPPYDAPTEGVERRGPEGILLRANVPRGGESEARARRELEGYYAHGTATDAAIGRLIDRLKLCGAWSRTVVVFTSVHGDMHGAHGLFRKGWPHEESVRVPLLVRLPGGGHGVFPRAVSLVELPAMARAWAEGVVWAGGAEAARISMPSVVKLPLQCERVWKGLRSARRKIILGKDGRPWLFFDLERDPLEMKNLVGDLGHVREVAEWRDRVVAAWA